jgi:hypothetical protein
VLVLGNIRVRSLTPRHLEVSWEVTSPFEDALDYTIRVMRSESEEGPYDYVSDAFEDKYLYIDSRVDLETRQHRRWYYKLEVTRKSSRAVALYGPSDRAPRADLVATELRRQAQLRFQKVAGRQCWLFPIRTFGQRCPTCYDRVTQDSQRTNCPTCYNTTYARGFHTPIEVWMQFEPTAVKADAAGGVRREANTSALAHMGYYPRVKKGDLLVEPENRRWIVDTVGNGERLRAIVRQDVYLMEIELGDVRFEVPVNYAALHTSDFANPFFFQPRMSPGEKVKWR